MTKLTDPKTLVIDDTVYETKHTVKFARRKPYAPADVRQVVAFIPGVIQDVMVHAGQKVRRGQPLVVLEAMKMRNAVLSPIEAKIRQVEVEKGQIVAKGQILVHFE